MKNNHKIPVTKVATENETKEQNINKELLAILVCPLCAGNLIYDKPKQELICLFDSLAYPIKNAKPYMLENHARTLTLAEKDALKSAKKPN